MNASEACPNCEGSGYTFFQIREDVRSQRTCPVCDGTGSIVTALARKLSGDESSSDPNYTEREKSLASKYGLGPLIPIRHDNA